MDHIEKAALAYPELAEKYTELGGFYERKLWHQLTGALSTFLHEEANRREDNFILLYSNFISKFEGKLNQLELAKLMGPVVASFPDAESKYKFIDDLLEKTVRLGSDATLLITLLRLNVKLQSRATDGTPESRSAQMLELKKEMEAKKVEVDALSGVADTVIHATFFELAAEYYKDAGPPEEYYKHALMLLSYSSIDSMNPEKAVKIAKDMSLAALSGDGLYNFGEVLATPIVAVLDNTPHAWLGEMLRIFNRGDITQFALLYDANKTAIEAEPAIFYRMDFIKEKLILLALMNFVFETPSEERTIPFPAVAAHCQITADQVEWVAMKAMSLGLIKGSMDEVDQTLTVDWVQPRVLDNSQMKHLADRLGGWAEKVKQTSHFIEDQTLELGI